MQFVNFKQNPNPVSVGVWEGGTLPIAPFPRSTDLDVHSQKNPAVQPGS